MTGQDYTTPTQHGTPAGVSYGMVVDKLMTEQHSQRHLVQGLERQYRGGMDMLHGLMGLGAAEGSERAPIIRSEARERNSIWTLSLAYPRRRRPHRRPSLSPPRPGQPVNTKFCRSHRVASVSPEAYPPASLQASPMPRAHMQELYVMSRDERLSRNALIAAERVDHDVLLSRAVGERRRLSSARRAFQNTATRRGGCPSTHGEEGGYPPHHPGVSVHSGVRVNPNAVSSRLYSAKLRNSRTRSRSAEPPQLMMRPASPPHHPHHQARLSPARPRGAAAAAGAEPPRVSPPPPDDRGVSPTRDPRSGSGGAAAALSRYSATPAGVGGVPHPAAALPAYLVGSGGVGVGVGVGTPAYRHHQQNPHAAAAPAQSPFPAVSPERASPVARRVLYFSSGSSSVAQQQQHRRTPPGTPPAWGGALRSRSLPATFSAGQSGGGGGVYRATQVPGLQQQQQPPSAASGGAPRPLVEGGGGGGGSAVRRVSPSPPARPARSPVMRATRHRSPEPPLLPPRGSSLGGGGVVVPAARGRSPPRPTGGRTSGPPAPYTPHTTHSPHEGVGGVPWGYRACPPQPREGQVPASPPPPLQPGGRVAAGVTPSPEGWQPGRFGGSVSSCSGSRGGGGGGRWGGLESEGSSPAGPAAVRRVEGGGYVGEEVEVEVEEERGIGSAYAMEMEMEAGRCALGRAMVAAGEQEARASVAQDEADARCDVASFMARHAQRATTHTPFPTASVAALQDSLISEAPSYGYFTPSEGTISRLASKEVADLAVPRSCPGAEVAPPAAGGDGCAAVPQAGAAGQAVGEEAVGDQQQQQLGGVEGEGAAESAEASCAAADLPEPSCGPVEGVDVECRGRGVAGQETRSFGAACAVGSLCVFFLTSLCAAAMYTVSPDAWPAELSLDSVSLPDGFTSLIPSGFPEFPASVSEWFAGNVAPLLPESYAAVAHPDEL